MLQYLNNFRYEFIAKLESNEADTKCILEHLDLAHVFPDVPQVNVGLYGSSESQVQNQFRTLTKAQISGLYEKYKRDFEAFEYDYASFYRLGVD